MEQENKNIPCILIVDDDQVMLQAAAQMLTLRMPETKLDICDNAHDALKLIELYDYDAIVSDIKMPGMDGLDLLDKVQERRPETPILLITGHGEHDLAIQALRGGAYDYILKPIDRDAFTAALRRAVMMRQLRRQVREQQIMLAHHARSLEQLVQKRTIELEEANARKDKLLTIVSQELKPPLGNLKEMAQMLHRQLEHEDAIEQVRQGLLSMERSIERTEVLAQDLLNTSLIDTNMFLLQRKRHNLVELCQDWLHQYTAGIGPVLLYETTDLPVEVELDSNRIFQVLINLLFSTRKHAPKGSPIIVTVETAGFEAILSVHNRETDIPPEEFSHIHQHLAGSPQALILSGSHPA
ncbi:MAG TPA: hybrid sensor histidine kinase/response regulator, partial [Ktedonobacteraceae bacterium]|nr:hybrid sensor histidine kinase/response regulator [Ktedonobacteraceae bacterium]